MLFNFLSKEDLGQKINGDFLILEKAQRQPRDIPRLSPEAKESIIESTKRNIQALEEAKGNVRTAISEAKNEIKNAIKEQKEENKTAEESDKKDDVSVLGFFVDLNSPAKEIEDKAEEFVVNSLPRTSRELLKPMMFSSELVTETGLYGDKYSYTVERKTGSLLQVLNEAIKREKADLVRFQSAEETEPEEIKEVIQEIGREKPRAENIEEFINESLGEQRKFDNFSYERLVNELKSALMSELFEREGAITPEQQEEMATITDELQENVSLAGNILSGMGNRDVDSLRNLRKVLISISRELKKNNRNTDGLESQISPITERLQEFEEPEGTKIAPKTLTKLKDIKKMLERLERSRDEDLMILEVLGKGNPAKNTFSELKKISRNPQSVFYVGVPRNEKFLAPLSVVEKKFGVNRYNRPKKPGEEMERYKELGDLGQDIHDLLNKEEEEKTLLQTLRDVYRSMTGQILDIGADKELQRKFRDERRKRIARIKESRPLGFGAERAIAERDRRNIPEGMTRIIDAETGESKIVSEEEAERIEQERAKDFISVEEMRERRKTKEEEK